jgi:toxin ParE1/3/4
MVYNHSISRLAQLDIDKALDYYKSINSELNASLYENLQKAISDIKNNPLLFQKINKTKSYRKININRFPYKLIYRIDKTEIIIVAFAHHKRKPNYWKK